MAMPRFPGFTQSLPFHRDPKFNLPPTCCSQVCFAAFATVGSALLSGFCKTGWKRRRLQAAFSHPSQSPSHSRTILSPLLEAIVLPSGLKAT
ncbi:MAG: hypothetical protein KME11_12395 [Timaviella obliquedivisa GSE-PSE-MK23-08B]|nr:hypothetical protein [Timaviella obliquedivisa GSE-PSE-MK23-08B]